MIEYLPPDLAIFGSIIGAAAGLIGSKIAGDNAEDAANSANRQSKEVLQNQIQWKVKDAEKAGLHPLAALGMSPANYSPVVVGGSDQGATDAINTMGQGVQRAVQAYQSKEQRQLEMASASLSLENQQLQNERLRSEIALMQPGSPPGMAANPYMSGQGDSDTLKVPKEFIAGTSGLEVGERQGLQKMFFPGIGPVRTKSEALGEAMEDSLLGSAMVDLLYTLPDLGYNASRRLPSAVTDIAKYMHKNKSGIARYKKWKERR